MDENDPNISYFATTNFHRAAVSFGIRQTDRLLHMYVIGKTGVGKSTLLEVLARSDLEAGRGFALVDPHGDLVERITPVFTILSTASALLQSIVR